MFVRVRLDQAGIGRKALPADKPFGHTALHGRHEQLAQQIALAEAAMPVLREDATQAYLTALLLAEVMPSVANQAENANGQVVGDRSVGPLYRVAERIARNREVLGLHYRSDTAAGRLLAEVTFLLLKECPWTRTIINLARKEW